MWVLVAGPREIALGIMSAIQVGPNPLPLELRDFDAQAAAELITLLARELEDADIKVDRVDVPASWFAEIMARLDEHALSLPIVPVDAFEYELRVYRAK